MSEAAALDRDPREELAELAASVRAYVEWQADTGAGGLPVDDAAAALASLGAGPPGKPGARPGPPAGPPQFTPAGPPQFAPAGPSDAARPRPPVFEPATPAWAAAEPRAAEPAPPRAAPPAVAKPAPPVAPAPPRQTEAASTAALSADSPDERRTRLALIAEEVRSCTKCVLHEKRRQTVFARGNPLAELCFVGEGPGADEDAQGEPFVGAAGQLLDKMIAAMGYRRDEVYICNIVKCRPPSNRKPEPEEMAACTPYLTQQLALVQPRVLVALGATAVQGLVGTSEGITRLRGKWKLYKGTIPMMPTFHPAYLLRQPAAKRDVWSDLQEVMKHLGKSPAKA